MKFYLVLLILICGGGWYYYDIHYAKSSFFKKGSEPQAVESALDSKQLELEQKAKELFPTKVSERAAWAERQMAAYNQISKVRDGISPEIAASIRKFADRKYPLDYDKQLDVGSKQELAAIIGTAKAKRRSEKAARLSLSIERAMLSAPKNRTQLTAALAQRERQTACLTMRPIFPFCPRMYSCAARWEMVVVKPAEVMLHASIYSGRIS